MPKPNGEGNLNCVYDAWNHMVEVVGTARYDYDGINFRIKKSVGKVVTKSFFYIDRQEIESRGSSETMAYVWGLWYIDDLIYRERNSKKLFSLADPHWIIFATVGESDEVQERFVYDAFGKVNDLSSDWSRTFTGQVLDHETGAMLYRNWFYHPELGRFVQRDPIGYDQADNNLYPILFLTF